MAGHVTVGDGAFLSGNVVVHQFTRVGELAMVGGGSAVRQDVLPFCLADGHPARPKGLNIVGLRRAGVPEERIAALKRAFRVVFRSGGTLDGRLTQALAGAPDGSEVARMISFIRGSKRGFARPRGRGRRWK
jgi:UDP-N-acetylglucosamine acyltransferase